MRLEGHKCCPLANFHDVYRCSLHSFSYELISSINELISSINELIGSINELIGSIDELIGSIDELVGSINELIGNINELIGTINQVVCKLLETLIRDHMVEFLVKHNLINTSQRGFLKARS